MSEDKLLQWRALEKAAVDAEVEFQRMGQGAASPEAAALAKAATELRDRADALFSEILLATRSS
jgi:hypothetical protein